MRKSFFPQYFKYEAILVQVLYLTWFWPLLNFTTRLCSRTIDFLRSPKVVSRVSDTADLTCIWIKNLPGERKGSMGYLLELLIEVGLFRFFFFNLQQHTQSLVLCHSSIRGTLLAVTEINVIWQDQFTWSILILFSDCIKLPSLILCRSWN